MRVSILSAAALAFGVASAGIISPPVSSAAPESSICAEEPSETPSATPSPSSSAASSSVTEWTTSTILSTQTFTVTKCPETVKHCPAESIVITTAVVTVGTTVCPVTEPTVVPTWPSKPPHPGHPSPPAPPAGGPHPTGGYPVKPHPTGGVPVKPEPTKATPVTAGAGRVAAPALALVAFAAALL